MEFSPVATRSSAGFRILSCGYTNRLHHASVHGLCGISFFPSVVEYIRRLFSRTVARKTAFKLLNMKSYRRLSTAQLCEARRNEPSSATVFQRNKTDADPQPQPIENLQNSELKTFTFLNISYRVLSAKTEEMTSDTVLSQSAFWTCH